MSPKPRPLICSSRTCVILFAALAIFFSACVAPRRPAPPVAVAGTPRPTPTRTRRVPSSTRTPGLEESTIGEAGAFTPAPGVAETPQPTPTAEAEADVAVSAGEPESLLTQISSTTPPNVAAALRLIEDGRQRMHQGAYDAALDRFERAVAIDPASAYGYYFLAQVQFFKKNYDQAMAFVSRAASLGGRTDRVSQGRIHSLQGAVFEEVGRYPDARKAYQAAITADPNNLAARVGIARLSGSN
ncbi:MAG: tetratricopeptide repeat protein [Candidatus Binatia bacterium]